MTYLSYNQLAHRDFERALRQAFWRDLISGLTRKNNNLLPSDQIRQRLPFKGEHCLGWQVIPLDQIVGSVGRYHDFDRAFFPRQRHLRDHWVSIDKAHYEQTPLPPVELFKVGEVYFVRDGNHRVSVARVHGQEFIDALVTEVEVPASGE
jgi:hypothetical protein